MHIVVDQAACVGAGQCALVAPEVFDQDDDGIVILLKDTPTGPNTANAERAARLCPARAITIAE